MHPVHLLATLVATGYGLRLITGRPFPTVEQLREGLERRKGGEKMEWRNASLGGSVGPGWEPLVDELHAKVLEHLPDVQVVQVKEKFGGLRYYLAGSSSSPEVNQLVRESEARSFKTCEWCGTTEDVKTAAPEGRWAKTLCPTHRAAWAKGERWW